MKSMDSFDFKAIRALNNMRGLELGRHSQKPFR